MAKDWYRIKNKKQRAERALEQLLELAPDWDDFKELLFYAKKYDRDIRTVGDFLIDLFEVKNDSKRN